MIHYRTFLFLLFTLLLFGCQPADEAITTSATTNDAQAIVKYAEGFQITTKEPGLQKLTIYDLGNNKQVLADFWLVNYAKFQGEMPDGDFMAVPVTDFACRSTTHLAFFNFLDQISSVKAVCYANAVINPKFKKEIAAGKIQNLTTSEEVDLELLAAISPQVFTTYPYGNVNENRIGSFGITSIPVVEYLENTPIKRAEWVKLFGVLLGQEQKANAGFNKLYAEYQSILDQVKKHVDVDALPTVFTGASDGGKWSAPSGKSFIAQFIRDAGAQYVFDGSNTDGNIELEYEAFYAKVIDSDYWGKVIFENGDVSKESLLGGDPRLDNLKAVKNNQIFYCNASTTDYFGDAIMQPEVILQDLVNIFHTEISTNDNRFFVPYIP